MFVVHTRIPLDPDSRERAVTLANDLAAAARGVDGVIRYRPAVPSDDCALQFFEQYADRDAIDAKEALPEYGAFAAALPDIAAGEIETVQTEPDEPPTAVQFDASEAVPEE